MVSVGAWLRDFGSLQDLEVFQSATKDQNGDPDILVVRGLVSQRSPIDTDHRLNTSKDVQEVKLVDGRFAALQNYLKQGKCVEEINGVIATARDYAIRCCTWEDSSCFEEVQTLQLTDAHKKAIIQAANLCNVIVVSLAKQTLKCCRMEEQCDQADGPLAKLHKSMDVAKAVLDDSVMKLA